MGKPKLTLGWLLKMRSKLILLTNVARRHEWRSKNGGQMPFMSSSQIWLILLISRFTSSYFLSESSAIIWASCNESSKAAIRSSFWKLKFSSTLRPLPSEKARSEWSGKGWGLRSKVVGRKEGISSNGNHGSGKQSTKNVARKKYAVGKRKGESERSRGK